MPDVYIAPEPHEHGPTSRLGLEEPWLEPYRPRGSVYLCDCGRLVIRNSFGEWKPLRWWHVRAHHRIRQAVR